MNDPLFYHYYDKIYSNKNYRDESQLIIKKVKEISGEFPENILDVGCGTGNHAFHFASEGCNVLGCDLDCDEIKIANEKVNQRKINNVSFLCGDVDLVEKDNFNLAVSLFNVVSYITRIDELEKFFTAINSKLNKNGIFVFDCWNGVAALLDPPVKKESTLKFDEETINIQSIPSINYMKQLVEVKNSVEICSEEETKKFEYTYVQRLWTPEVLGEILNRAGFKILSINKSIDFTVLADHKTWKILFLCKKN